ncbi:MAG: hypothetical protein HN712_16770 [Gemmatimonadetes bacterium]|jgi:hypothetical protein|nr:hypothetical protein [Gemmatimonadota bacterium]MBT6145471.1 hypothetical protein [Gemmatimonadota bacterium]MBT7861971.1 hypothetical protein [Gemmatimonadota bacterium]
MPTKKQIADGLRERLADVAERGKVIGHALGVRADMAATRRRLRATYAELGEEMYRRLQAGEFEGDHQLLTLKERLDGLKAEARMHEGQLRDIMQAGFANGDRAADGAGGATAP